MAVKVRELPDDLVALERLLADPAMLGAIVERFRREVTEERRSVLTDGRPTIAMETYVSTIGGGTGLGGPCANSAATDCRSRPVRS